MDSDIPTLNPITVFPLCRPDMDNTHIESFMLWTIDNGDRLKRYFEALCRIPLEGNEQVRFGVWIVIQWEVEQANALRHAQLEEQDRAGS
jgi:hypothetical protein